MRLLAQQNHVVWVSFHASRRPQFTTSDTRMVLRRLRQVWNGPKQVTPQIEVLNPLLIPMPEWGFVRQINRWVLTRQIRNVLRRLPRRPAQLWFFTPDIPELRQRLRVERVVYYCVDDFAAFGGWNTALVERLEAQTMGISDVVITTSTKLYEERRDRHPAVHLVPHGVDYEHFAAAPRLPADAVPPELRQIPRPTFGYMGLISDYVDLDLIGRAARRRPDWSFVLIGDARCQQEAISGLPNVHRLGPRPYEQLPAYCRGFDVGLIPFRLNRLTRAVNPIKLREYLAAGLPVVSSPMAEVLKYAPAVHTAETPDEFVAACSAALAMANDGHPERRQELVRGESWRARVEVLSRLVMGDGDAQPDEAAPLRSHPPAVTSSASH